MFALRALLLLACPAEASSTWEGLTFYTGDPHAHSGISRDGWSADIGYGCGSHRVCGYTRDVFDTARSNGLDWVGMSEHTNGTGFRADEDEYEEEIARSLEHYEEGDPFVTLPSAEVWFRNSDGTALGHKNLLMFGDNDVLAALDIADTSPRGDDGERLSDCSDIETWMDSFTATFGNAILIPHHTSLEGPMPTDWTCHSDKYEVGAEVYSHFGNNLEGHFDYDAPKTKIDEDGTIDVAMDPDGLALKMSFWGGSDFHGSTPGRLCGEGDLRKYGSGGFTVAVLDEGDSFSRTTLYDAILARHTYATSGPSLPFRVTYEDSRGDIGTMGDDIAVRGGDDLTLLLEIDPTYADMITTVYLETPDEAIEVTNEGDGVWTATVAADEIPAWVYPVIQLDGEAWFGDDWCEDGGADATETIWASPSWTTIEDHDDDADGVSWSAGDCDDLDGARTPGTAEVWYDGIDGDCAGGDDFDADLDGFEYGADCDDGDGEVAPYMPEVWYDGVDTNCDGADDFDQDGDGVAVDTDCDDTDTVIHPGATDTWYDGIDTNCDGADDYDRDGDGVRPPADCDDIEPRIRPGVPEHWYDGIDDNCDRRDDYDRDNDHKRAWPWGPDRYDRDASRWH